jgi:hypothetical protein
MHNAFELIFGVDVAVKKLRPGAHFQLNNTTFDIWNDPDGRDPPTWEEILTQINQDKQQFNILTDNVNKDIDIFPPSDQRVHFWNEEDGVWEQEPDYDVK